MVTIQPVLYSERERRTRVKRFPKLAEFEVRHGSLLAFLGDERPRGPNTRSEASVELRTFLDTKGITVPEFVAMRGGEEDTVVGEKETVPPATTATLGHQPSPTPLLGPPPTTLGPPLGSLGPPPPAMMAGPPQFGPNGNLLFPGLGGPPLGPPGLGPPMVAWPQPMVPQPGPQDSRMVVLSTLCARALKVEGDAARGEVEALLQTEEEVQQAVHLVKVLTAALLATVTSARNIKQQQLKNQAILAGASEPVLQSMQRQAAMAEAGLARLDSRAKIQQAAEQAAKVASKLTPGKRAAIQAAADQALASGGAASARKPMSSAMEAAMAGTLAALPAPPITTDALATFEKTSRDAAMVEQGSKGMNTAMKKRLEAFRATKEVKEVKGRRRRSSSPEVMEVNSQGEEWAARGREHLEERDMEPLALLRRFVTLKRKILERGTNLDFQGIFHPKSVRTPLRVGQLKEPPEFYTLGCLAYLVAHQALDHPEYVRKCIAAKVKCVRRPDREAVLGYLSGRQDAVIILERLSHRELNPELFGGEAFAPERLARGGERGERERSEVGREEREGSEAERRVKEWKERIMGRSAASAERPSGRTTPEVWAGVRSRSDTVSPNQGEYGGRQASQPPAAKRSRFDQPPAGFDQRGLGGSGFDQRSTGGFDQRAGSGFDQRASSAEVEARQLSVAAAHTGLRKCGLPRDAEGRPIRAMSQLQAQARPGAEEQGRGNGFDQRQAGGFDQRQSRFDQRSGGGLNQRQEDDFDQRQGSGFDQRQGSGFDQRQGSGFDQRQGSGFDQRQVSSFDQRQGSGFDQRGGALDQRLASSFDQRQGSMFDQREASSFEEQRQGSGFDQRQTASFGEQRPTASFGEQRGFSQEGGRSSAGFDASVPLYSSIKEMPMGSFGVEGRGRRGSGEGRGQQGFYEEDFEYDRPRSRNSGDGGMQGMQGMQASPWVGDPANSRGGMREELAMGANPAFTIGARGQGGGQANHAPW